MADFDSYVDYFVDYYLWVINIQKNSGIYLSFVSGFLLIHCCTWMVCVDVKQNENCSVL